MTDQQRAYFRLNGCVPRCLMKLCELEGNKMSEDDFCAAYDGYFGGQLHEYGILDFSRFSELIQELHLPQNNKFENDYAVAEQEKNQRHRKVLVWTERDLRLGHRHEIIKHCNILTQIDANRFSLWTPTQDGLADSYDNEPRAEWIKLICKAWIMY